MNVGKSQPKPAAMQVQGIVRYDANMSNSREISPTPESSHHTGFTPLGLQGQSASQ